MAKSESKMAQLNIANKLGRKVIFDQRQRVEDGLKTIVESIRKFISLQIKSLSYSIIIFF